MSLPKLRGVVSEHEASSVKADDNVTCVCKLCVFTKKEGE